MSGRRPDIHRTGGNCPGDGHYARALPLNLSTTNYSIDCSTGCTTARFSQDATALAGEASGAKTDLEVKGVVTKALSDVDSATSSSGAIGGLLSYLTGGSR